MLKKTAFFVTTLMLISTLTSCENQAQNTQDSIVVALSTRPKTLDPRRATDANGMRISELLFHSLVKVGPDLEVIGDAAEKWTYNDLIYTFYLKKNLTFSNGNPVTTEDIEYSIKEYLDPKNIFHSAFTSIKKFSAKNKAGRIVVKLYLKYFSAKLLSSDLPVLKILPKSEAQKRDYETSPMGSGPFVLSQQNSNKIVLSARENFGIKYKKIIFKITRDDFTRYQKMIRGEIDIAQSELPKEKIQNFEKKPEGFFVYKYPGLSTSYILLNLKDPVIRQINFRKALAYSLNRSEIIDHKLGSLATKATGLLTPSNPFFHKGLKPIKFNPQKAKALLKKVSELKEVSLKTSSGKEAIDNGKVLAHQFKSIGIPIKLKSFEWGTFYNDIKKGNYQLAIMRWVGVFDPDIYRIAFHSKELPPGRNRGFYSNKILDKILESGLSITNQKRRIQHYKKAQAIIFRELAIIPLWYDHEVAIVNKRIKGYTPWKNGSFSSLISAYK